jgi:glycosyltransferase involved in cell wall biosynthesis
MKVVIFNTSHSGGAAIAANRLAIALRKEGVEVMLLSRKDNVINRLRFLWERFLIFLACRCRRKNLFRVSIANTGADISRHPFVQEADILHLHWINHGFLSLTDIRKLSRLGKPLLWTMHDMWPFTAICHYAGMCKRYRTRCYDCPVTDNPKGETLSSATFRRKRKLLEQADITFVGCSEWIATQARSGILPQHKPVCAIPNPIDITLFRPLSAADKATVREKFGLPLDKKLLLFGALNISDKRKGVDYLIEAFHYLSREGNTEDIEIIAFGQVKKQIHGIRQLPFHHVGYITDDQQKVDLYNAVDLFVTPSLEENLPNTVMEAMACGTPCAAFRVGGIPEMIAHQQNGYLADREDSHDLAHGIRWILQHNADGALSAACRQAVEVRYAEPLVSKQYIDLYNNLLNPTETSR